MFRLNNNVFMVYCLIGTIGPRIVLQWPVDLCLNACNSYVLFGWYMFDNVTEANFASPSGESLVLLLSDASKETASVIAKVSNKNALMFWLHFAMLILYVGSAGSKTVFFSGALYLS
jgi:hypothetical protein